MNEADPRVRLPTGILRFQEEGTTLGDIRKSYPNCFLLLRNPDPNNCDKEFHRDAFVLQANTTYELIIPNVNPTVNQPHQVPGAAVPSIVDMDLLVEHLKKLSTSSGDIPLSDMDDPVLLNAVEIRSPIPKTVTAGEGDAVMTEVAREQMRVACLTKEDGPVDEHKLIVHMTPLITQIVNEVYPHAVVLNSEESQWLKRGESLIDKKHDLKPDITVVLRGLHLDSNNQGSEKIQEYRRNVFPEFRFEFGHPNLQFLDALKVVLEFKALISRATFASLFRYLLCLSKERPDLLFTGLLCDWRGFYLYRCAKGVVQNEAHLYLWTSPGSLKVIRDVLTPNPQDGGWAYLLRNALHLSNVRLATSNAFLGGGAYGRVFKVVAQVANVEVANVEVANVEVANVEEANVAGVQALKIVLIDQTSTHRSDQGMRHKCSTEYQALLNLANSRYVVPAVPNSLQTLLWPETRIPCGIFYLMEVTGSPVDKRNRRQLSQAFNALAGLHSLDQYHGDARISNVVLVGEVALWVDFMQYSPGGYTIQTCQQDLTQFVQSVVGPKATVPNDVADAYFRAPLLQWENTFNALSAQV